MLLFFDVLTMNPWHDVSFGDAAPEVVRAIIEIPRNSRTKLEIDKESGLIIMDRYLHSSVTYPQNYGFIPQTYCDDKDPLDVLVITQAEIVPMCLVDARVVGVLQMEDGGEQDDKIIAVADNDFTMKDIKDLSDVPQYMIDEIRVFFEDYKKLEKKEVIVKDFKGRDAAIQVVKDSIELYKKTFA